MKTIFAKHYILILATILLAPAALAQSGGGFDLSWSTIDGGGGASSGGSFTLNGTIGQPDAGGLSGGLFTVAGGFWSVTLPDPPLLAIRRTTTNTVAVSWPSPSTGYVLQQNTNSISSVNWSNVVSAPSDDGTTKAVIVNPAAGNRFYRLTHP